jgi:DNA-binding CsgD family transcriptional regulator
MKNRGQPFKNPEGRPSKEREVKNYIKHFPDKTVSQIARELGVSRPTVYKYM